MRPRLESFLNRIVELFAAAFVVHLLLGVFLVGIGVDAGLDILATVGYYWPIIFILVLGRIAYVLWVITH